MAMRMMGEQFVTGETIAEALANAARSRPRAFRYSYDMLGEAALTSERCTALPRLYEQAIHAIGKASPGAAFTKARASPSSCRPCTRATAARSTTA
jgi:RHH-type proline utilization regulon transcriptional repressor/proline dehydrogenase/delta 1-pyrroline-5-carboxylate dehydrogenase